MKTEFPHIDLPVDVLAATDITEEILNIYKESCKLKATIFAICVEGSMEVSINLINYTISKNDLITLPPESVIQFKEFKDNIKLYFIGFSSECAQRANLFNHIIEIYPEIINTPILNLSEKTVYYLNTYISFIADLSTNAPEYITEELANLTLRTIVHSISQLYIKEEEGESKKEIIHSHEKEICKKLVYHITKHYKEEHKAAFYATQLKVSLPYLSKTVKKTTGKTISEIIAHVVIVDAKAKLKSTAMTIQEISYSLNFPNASFFSRYFKQHVGMTPVAYRNS